MSSFTVRKMVVASFFLVVAAHATAQVVGACHFDVSLRQFQGTPLQQAQCLLRHVARWGKVSRDPAVLPPALEKLVGKPVTIGRDQIRKHLAASGLVESAVGGNLDVPIGARYFVIHDTSSPWLGDIKFPADNASILNNLASYKKVDAVAHIFVSRTGQTFLGHNFSVPWRATKLETKLIGAPARGLFLHVELLQPRRRDPAGGPKNDALAPTPGFTVVQYERLALLYATASARAGLWLIPAMHAPIDEGQIGAHDDPQNFVLAEFVAALERLLPSLVATGSEQQPALALPTSPTASPSAGSS